MLGIGKKLLMIFTDILHQYLVGGRVPQSIRSLVEPGKCRDAKFRVSTFEDLLSI